MNDEDRLAYETARRERDVFKGRLMAVRNFLESWAVLKWSDFQPEHSRVQINKAIKMLACDEAVDPKEALGVADGRPSGPGPDVLTNRIMDARSRLISWLEQSWEDKDTRTATKIDRILAILVPAHSAEKEPAVDAAEDARQISPRPFMWICPTCQTANAGRVCKCGYSNAADPKDYPKVYVKEVQHDETNRLKGIISRTRSALSNWTHLLEPTGDEPICAMLDQLERMLEGE